MSLVLPFLMCACLLSDPSAAGAPPAEAVCEAVSGAGSPGAGAPCGGSLHQNRHDNLRADHQEGLRPGFRRVSHACCRPPHDEEPHGRHGHDHLPWAAAREHRHQPEEQLCCGASGTPSSCTIFLKRKTVFSALFFFNSLSFNLWVLLGSNPPAAGNDGGSCSQGRSGQLWTGMLLHSENCCGEGWPRDGQKAGYGEGFKIFSFLCSHFYQNNWALF